MKFLSCVLILSSGVLFANETPKSTNHRRTASLGAIRIDVGQKRTSPPVDCNTKPSMLTRLVRMNTAAHALGEETLARFVETKDPNKSGSNKLAAENAFNGLQGSARLGLPNMNPSEEMIDRMRSNSVRARSGSVPAPASPTRVSSVAFSVTASHNDSERKSAREKQYQPVDKTVKAKRSWNCLCFSANNAE